MPRLALLIVLSSLIAATAARADFADAIFAYDQGDYATTYAESRPLAEAGVAEAQYMLGLLYDRGEGIGRDPVRAYLWYRLAAKAGDAFAAKAAASVARRMNKKQSAAARALLDDWRPTTD